jgi:hypothetical protein
MNSSPSRVCGGCTACCKTHGIRELNKPPGTWCRHCRIGEKCSIYNSRPKSCREYACSWLQGIGTEETRPDKIGFVGEFGFFDPFGRTLIIFEAEDGALSSEICRRWSLNNLWNKYCVVHRALDGDHKMYLPQRFPMMSIPPVFEFTGITIQQVPYAEALVQLAT